MDWIQYTPQQRPADKAWPASDTGRTKRRKKGVCAPLRAPRPDRLTALPQELFTDILQRVSLTPIDNIRLQAINRRFRDTLRDNSFWRHVSPEAPRPNGPLTVLQQEFAAADALVRPPTTHPSELLYRQFQARTAQGPLGYTPMQQQLLLYFWTQTRHNTFLIDPNSPYDLARAAVAHAHPLYTFSRYGDDASLMQARAVRGAEHIRALSPRLRSDASFMHRVINLTSSDYAIADASLREDPSFNRPILQRHGRALSLMPENIRANKQLALTALQHWESDAVFPSLQPYLTVAEALRTDPEILFACTKLCPNSFVLAAQRYPWRHWGADRGLVTIALTPHLRSRLMIRSNPHDVFSHVHPSLRDDESISLLAVTHAQTNYGLVSERLRLSFDWCAKALALNPRLTYVLDPKLRDDPALIDTMPAQTQLQYLYPLQSTIGSNPATLERVLRNPDAKHARHFEQALLKAESVYRRIDMSLKNHPQVLRAILDFDGREIDFLLHDRQENIELYQYAFQAFLRQLITQHETQSLRLKKIFAVRMAKPNGHPALGIFAHDKRFAQQLLLRLPECDYLFAPEVRSLPDIRDLSRLGMLLQEEAGRHTTQGTTMSAPRLLLASLRNAPDSFVLHMALGAFYMIRNDWTYARTPFLRALVLGQADTSTRQSIVCQRLWQSFPDACPQRGDFWYRGVMAIMRHAYKCVLERSGLVDQAHVLLS